MSLRLVVRPVADRELAELAAYIRSDNRDAARRFLLSVRKAFQDLIRYAEMGKLKPYNLEYPNGLRMWPVPKFEKHLIFYRVYGDHLEIIRILHGARDIPAALANETP